MHRGPLYRDDYRPRLSGHETFPLRYGWLKKTFDAVEKACEEADGPATTRTVFLAEDAIARFGVGKNMVASMRHWASMSGIIGGGGAAGRIAPTSLGRRLFGAHGLDPYFEHPSTAWLIHWQLCARPEKTTWFWAFNHYPSTSFDRELLVKGLARLASDRGWPRASIATIRSDVRCFVRTYVSLLPSGQTNHEDALESPLTELGLIKPVGNSGAFRFVRGVKPTLGSGAFCYAIASFWDGYSDANTLSLEALAHEPGSPGRVFMLDENSLVDRLSRLEEASNGHFRWSETVGLKQLARDCEVSADQALRFIDSDYC